MSKQFKTSEEQKLWEDFLPVRQEMEQYAELGEEPPEELAIKWAEMRNKMVAHYYKMMVRIAESVGQKITQIDADALASMGVYGLYDAIDIYHPDKGNKFETYASKRIRGSICDEIRREDWMPRLLRQQVRKLDRVKGRFIAEHGRVPLLEELAAEMELPLSTVSDIYRAHSTQRLQSLNVSFGDSDGNDNDEVALMHCISDENAPEVDSNMITQEVESKLLAKGFTPLERQIVVARFWHDMSMAEMSQRFGLSESRLSQLLNACLERMRDKVVRNPDFFGPEAVKMVNK